MRCRNPRLMPELPTVETLNSRRNSRSSSLLKTSHWPLGVHTRHVRYDQDSESLSQLSAKRRNSRPSELPTHVGTPDEPTREQQFYHCWANSEHVRYCQTSKNKVSSFITQILKTHMAWLEHLCNIIYQHDASLLIVRRTY